MKIIGVIPARYASTRLEGKVLADIGGKPMVQHAYEAALQSHLLEKVIVAVDDQRVYNVVIAFGEKQVMTDPIVPRAPIGLLPQLNHWMWIL